MRCTLLHTSAAIASYCVATHCMPLRLLHFMELQTIALQATSDHGGYRKLVRASRAVASYCKPWQAIASYFKLLQAFASYCKLLRAFASYCQLS